MSQFVICLSFFLSHSSPTRTAHVGNNYGHALCFGLQQGMLANIHKASITLHLCPLHPSLQRVLEDTDDFTKRYRAT